MVWTTATVAWDFVGLDFVIITSEIIRTNRKLRSRAEVTSRQTKIDLEMWACDAEDCHSRWEFDSMAGMYWRSSEIFAEKNVGSTSHKGRKCSHRYQGYAMVFSFWSISMFTELSVQIIEAILRFREPRPTFVAYVLIDDRDSILFCLSRDTGYIYTWTNHPALMFKFSFCVNQIQVITSTFPEKSSKAAA